MASSTQTNYVPDATAIPGGSLSTALLSQRDLSLQIPINFVTHPGIALSTCFSDNLYEDTSARTCLSNILAAGFRRIAVDIYWDVSRRTWSLCPVELGNLGPGVTSTSDEPTSIPTGAATLSSASFSDPARLARAEYTDLPHAFLPSTSKNHHVTARQVLSTETSMSIDSTTSVDTHRSSSRSNSDPTSTPATVPGFSETIYQVGSFQCSESINLNLVTDTFAGFFQSTGNSVNATLQYLILNLHVAAQASQAANTPSLSQLPASGEYLGQAINASLASYLYTPYSLNHERENLNISWYSVSPAYQPAVRYFNTSRIAADDLATDNGWPSEGFVEIIHAKRLLVGMGSIDPQIYGYNTSVDDQTIFSAGELTAQHNVTLSEAAEVIGGCFLDNDTMSVTGVNSSFAVAGNAFSTASILSLPEVVSIANNVTSCGISPFLQQEINNASADMNGLAYMDFVQGTIWSWNIDQPSDNANTTNYAQLSDAHCAALNMTAGGKWQVASCNNEYYAACRLHSQPYNWTISRQSGPFDTVPNVCPEGSAFGVPRTALENSYLRAAILGQRSGNSRYSSDLFWLNFNDLDVSGCWVDGVNSTCPYGSRAASAGRRVTIPTVAAVIVFVLAALTIFVKCAANRGNSKQRRRRKRGDGGWDYEGVPS